MWPRRRCGEAGVVRKLNGSGTHTHTHKGFSYPHPFLFAQGLVPIPLPLPLPVHHLCPRCGRVAKKGVKHGERERGSIVFLKSYPLHTQRERKKERERKRRERRTHRTSRGRGLRGERRTASLSKCFPRAVAVGRLAGDEKGCRGSGRLSASPLQRRGSCANQ